MTAFKVMTWNLENLFQAGSEFGPKTQEDYEQKLTRLANVILQLDPDVLGVQEVGDLASFNDLVGRLQGRYPHTKLSNHPDGRGIRVGFLSKFANEADANADIPLFSQAGLSSVPGVDSAGNPSDMTKFGRGVLRIRVSPSQGTHVTLMTAHLKSKLLTYPSPPNRPRFDTKDENERARVAGWALLRRTAEAVTLRVHANELLGGNSQDALILLGDMNDVTDAATTQILQGKGGSEIGTRGFNTPDSGDDTRLFNLAPCIPEERRYSRIYRGNKELIDHIYVSSEMLPGNPRRTPVVNSHIDVTGDLPSITDDPNARRGKPGSDHAAITATFDL